MKRGLFWFLLAAEFIALLAVQLLTELAPALFSSLLAFPFEQIGLGLRELSLLGRLENGLAMALWAGLSLLPLIPAWRHAREPGLGLEHAALYLSAALLALALFGMANPSFLKNTIPLFAEQGMPVMKAILGGTVWSALILYAVLRLLRLFRGGDTPALLRYMGLLLYVLCFLFTGVIALSCGNGLLGELREAQRSMDGVMAVLGFLLSALPYGLDILIAWKAIALLAALRDGEGERAAEMAAQLSARCCLALGLTAASVVLWNILQLALLKVISNVAVSVNVPVMSLAYVLAVLLAARLIAENRRLRDDNDLFI